MVTSYSPNPPGVIFCYRYGSCRGTRSIGSCQHFLCVRRGPAIAGCQCGRLIELGSAVFSRTDILRFAFFSPAGDQAIAGYQRGLRLSLGSCVFVRALVSCNFTFFSPTSHQAIAGSQCGLGSWLGSVFFSRAGILRFCCFLFKLRWLMA